MLQHPIVQILFLQEEEGGQQHLGCHIDANFVPEEYQKRVYDLMGEITNIIVEANEITGRENKQTFEEKMGNRSGFDELIKKLKEEGKY